MLSYELGEIFKNNVFEEHVRTAAFENMRADEREVKAKFAICMIGQYNKNKISRTVPPLDNCPRTVSPWTTAPWTTASWTTAPWTIAPPGNCPSDYSHLGILYYAPDIHTRTITAYSNDNYKLQFFHGCFLFLFHGPIL